MMEIVASGIMVLGMLSSLLYFALGLREKKFLRQVSGQKRYRYIGNAILQRNLGRLAMIGSMGYMVSYFVSQKHNHPWAIFALLPTVWLFIEGAVRFWVSANINKTKENKI